MERIKQVHLEYVLNRINKAKGLHNIKLPIDIIEQALSPKEE